MVLPLVLFTLFALMASGGVFWALLAHRGRAAAVAGALGSLLFFTALFLGLWLWLWPQLEGL